MWSTTERVPWAARSTEPAISRVEVACSATATMIKREIAEISSIVRKQPRQTPAIGWISQIR